MSYQYKIEDNKAFLIDSNNVLQETNLPKLFHNDKLDEEFNIVESEIRETILVGTFSTSQTQRFGKNKKGNIIYFVKPLNLKLPGFMVSYGGKTKGKLIIRFKFIEWKNKLPLGQIIDVIGESNNENLERILMFHHNIFPRISKYKGNNMKIDRVELDLDIFSIDPENCTDIDDAMSIENKNGDTIIGIHIAQPIAFLSLSDIKNKIENQFSTLYLNNTRKDLWGKDITDKSSLFENEKRLAYSTFFHYKDSKLINTEDFASVIINKKNLNYDNANRYFPAKNLLNFTRELSEIEDYHDLVSYWMIKTNNYIGLKLKDYIPFRVNQQNEKECSIDDLPKDIGKKLISKKIEGAYYSFEKIKHETLDLEYYCHFTSPIRRIMDSWIHYILTYDKSPSNEIDLKTINILDKKTKKFHREIELNSVINKIFKEETTINRTGYITEIISNNLIEVYIEELGFLKVKLYSLIFDYLLEKENNFEVLTLKYKNEEYLYKTGSKIELIISKVDSILPKNKLVIKPKDAISFI